MWTVEKGVWYVSQIGAAVSSVKIRRLEESSQYVHVL